MKGKTSIYLYLFLFVVVLFIFYVDKDRGVDTTSKKTQEIVLIDTSSYERESKTIQKYEKYILPTRPLSEEESFLYNLVMFDNKKVTIDSLDDKDKLSVVLSYLDKDDYFEDKTYYQIYDDEGNELEHPKKISEKKYSPERQDIIVYKKITTSKINKIANKIFDTDINIPEEIIYNNNIKCTYDEKVECSNYKSSIVQEDYIRYVSSDLKDGEIHIYQKYLHETYLYGKVILTNGIETIDQEENGIKEITNDVIDKYGTTYKTTFKKGSDDKYYWYSTEPVEKIEK